MLDVEFAGTGIESNFLMSVFTATSLEIVLCVPQGLTQQDERIAEIVNFLSV